MEHMEHHPLTIQILKMMYYIMKHYKLLQFDSSVVITKSVNFV